jgi:hypothetical protein
MNLGPRDRDQILRYGVIGGAVLVVVIYGYIQLRTPDAAPPPVAAPVVKTSSARATNSGSVASATGAPTSPGVVTKSAAAESAAGKVGTTAAQYDPTLKMEAMLVAESLVYSGAGRNIFSATSAQPAVAIPKPVAPVRNAGVVLPVYTAPSGPPPPPPIDLKFFGTETLGDGSRQAFLLHGEDVFLAATGSIVQRRYKIGAISASSVEVEDLTNNNKQSLPLQKN